MSTHTYTNPNLTDTLLFEHFATLATAPDGIGRLRALILQIAVQGRLGTQDAGDEPASVLLERIQKEKEHLVKEGKTRNEKSLDSIPETAIPYQIPKNWAWTRFGEIGQIVGGGTPRTTNPEYYVKHGIPWLTPADLYRFQGKYIGKGRKDISESGLKESSAQLLPKGAILFSSRAPIGYVAIASNPLSTNQGFKSCIPYVFEMSEFIYYFLVSSAKEIDAKASGTTFKEVSGQEVKHILFPLPPLAEQHRIVAKVDRLMALCDELEARQQQERAGCLKLGTASFAGLQNAESPEESGRQWAQVCDAFDLILDCPENVAVLRQTILQLAVQGRLVRQDPGDEPAGKLVERIKKEKFGRIHKENQEDSINEVEIPYSIPEEWEWKKLGEICTLITDGTHITPTYIQKGIPFLSVKDVSKGNINFSDTRFISQEEHIEISKRCNPEFEDILFTKIGTTGIAKVIDVNREFSIFVSLALLKFPKQSIYPYYLELVLNSPFVKEQSKKNTQGVGNKNLVLKSIKTIDIPLPPLAEQHRIVAKVDALMALCDQLEAQLKERAGMQGKFADAVVKSIGTG